MANVRDEKWIRDDATCEYWKNMSRSELEKTKASIERKASEGFKWRKMTPSQYYGYDDCVREMKRRGYL